MVLWQEMVYMAVDCVGICKYHTVFLSPNHPQFKEFSKLIHLNTGLEFSDKDIWDVANRADYFGLKVPFECFGKTLAISDCLTNFHNVLVHYMPITFINEFVMLVLGMILLLAIVFK